MLKKPIFLLFFLTISLANAQDMFQEYLYSADLVMKNRDKISLTDAQADKIKKIHSTNAADFSTLKWDLDAETEKLKKLIEQPKPDATAVSKQMDLVLNLENQLKKKQLATLVAIKNELTENQQTELKKTKVMGRVTTWEYAPGGTATSLPRTTPQYRVGKEAAKATSVNGTAVVTTSPKIAVSVAGTGNQPIYFLETKSGLKKVTNLEGVNPDDIAAINVLKGDEATKLYGKEGENGVIIIKLKNIPE